MTMKKCKQCGQIMPEEQFRKYYAGRKGTYRSCVHCERINSRFKYLLAKTTRSEHDEEELAKIKALYDLLRENGLEPPAFGTGSVHPKNIMASIDALMEIQLKAQEKLKEVSEVVGIDLPAGTPLELIGWLENDLSVFKPEYLQDDVFEELQRRYRPQLGLDPLTLTVVYDDRYRDVLNKILLRFDEYEEAYEEDETNED